MGRKLAMFFWFVVVLCPLTVMIIAAIFGALLAEVEGWHFWDGFYYVVSNLTGLATPLTEVTPETQSGKIFDVLVAVWSLSLAGCIIGIVGSLSAVSSVVHQVCSRAEPPIPQRRFRNIALALLG